MSEESDERAEDMILELTDAGRLGAENRCRSKRKQLKMSSSELEAVY